MLSIVISYYNLGRTIEETVQNLLQIEYDNYEIILVNDGSTDPESIQKLAQLRAKYPALQIIDIPNGGLANVRNVGAAHARGEFLAFMDADDLVDPSYYTRCIHVLNRYENVSFVYSWLQYFEGADGVWTTFDTTLDVYKRQFYAFLCDGYFIDIGIPEDYAAAQEAFQSR